jgi:hypothetical protein
MNKLTKELAEQAAENFTQNFEWEHLQQIDKDIFEKFAELVVRECASISESYSSGLMPLSIALAIKQRFGVKE